jgi:hypothetical protein
MNIKQNIAFAGIVTALVFSIVYGITLASVECLIPQFIKNTIGGKS